jgi:putative ABC transport system permease protein
VLATRQISARPAYAVVQVSALAVGLLALVLLVLLRTDLISSWRKATPPDAPNRFVINVMPEQGDAFPRRTLRDAGVGKLRLVPDDPRAAWCDQRARRVARRLHRRACQAAGRPRVQPVAQRRAAAAQRGGRRRWQAEEAGAISIEEGIATTLNLKMGDTLRFDIGGVLQVDAKITSLRKVDWGSMRANFFAMYPVQQLARCAVTYMSAFKAPDTRGFDNALVREFPNITNVDISATLSQVQRVLDQVVRAVEFLFGFTLAAGWWCCLRPSPPRARSARASSRSCAPWAPAPACCARCSAPSWRAWACWRAFWPAWWRLWWAGAWRGLSLISNGRCRRGCWLVVPLAGAVLALAAGWWGLREVLNRPVVDTLRRALPCAAQGSVAPKNSLRALCALRSDSFGELEHEARCARRHSPLRCSAL